MLAKLKKTYLHDTKHNKQKQMTKRKNIFAVYITDKELSLNI